MKKLNLFFVAAATLATAFTTSCKDPEFAAPEVVFTNPSESTLEVAVGSDYTFKGTVTSADSSVTITEVQFLNNEVVMEAESVDITADGVSTYNFEVKIENIQEDFTLKVVAYDSDNKMSDASVEVTTTGLVEEKTITMGHFTESQGGFICLAEGVVYPEATAKANQAKVDLIYYWGNTKYASYYSPASYIEVMGANYADLDTWTTKNETKFSKKSAADYDTATSTTLNAATITDAYMQNIASGDVYMFETAAGLRGVIKVGAVVAPTKNIETITFTYKVEAPAAK